MAKQSKNITIIGSGISGMSTASYLAKAGYQVKVLEKNSTFGGRLNTLSKNGFFFDMGPSWYWMPDVFEKFYNDFGYTTSDFYDLIRLDPSYRVFFQDESKLDIPASLNEFYDLFEKLEKGSALKLKKFLEDAKVKYEVGMNEFVHKPSLSVLEFLNIKILTQGLKLDLFKSFSKYIRNNFKNPKLVQILEFPVLFLGAKPENTPALYSLMNYADIVMGTWYPMGGMYKISEAFYKIAKEQGVEFYFDTPLTSFEYENNLIKKSLSDNNSYESDAVVASADYHFIDQKILPKEYRNYSSEYWDSRILAPSCLLYYVGVNKEIKELLHHNLFFDADFNKHSAEIYDTKTWPENPLFYVCNPSATDSSVAPVGNTNLFILIPVATGLIETEEIVNKYFDLVIDRIEKRIKKEFKNDIVVKETFTPKKFIQHYNSFKGNAYGLANILKQTAFLKPKIKNKKLNNLYFTGQLTTPGPGLPPGIISGKVVANQLIKNFSI